LVLFQSGRLVSFAVEEDVRFAARLAFQIVDDQNVNDIHVG
jgi:hypothetical protein